jgi:hypothetical protein
MVNPFSRRTESPTGLCRTPKGVTGQREIQFLRLVGMVGIVRVRAEQENAAGDRVAHEGAALADPFTKAVVFEEALAEIGGLIGLPPVEFVGQRLDRLDQLPRARRRQSRQAAKRGDDGKGSSGCRPRAQLPRPVAQERLSFRRRLE